MSHKSEYDVLTVQKFGVIEYVCLDRNVFAVVDSGASANVQHAGVGGFVDFNPGSVNSARRNEFAGVANFDVGGGKSDGAPYFVAFNDSSAEQIFVTQALVGSRNVALHDCAANVRAAHLDGINSVTLAENYFNAEGLTIAVVVLKTFVLIATKVVVVTNEERCDSVLVAQMGTHELLCTKMAKIFGEFEKNDFVNAYLMQQALFLGIGGEQFGDIVFAQHAARMFLESNDNCALATTLRLAYQLAEQEFMSFMNTIEEAYRSNHVS